MLTKSAEFFPDRESRELKSNHASNVQEKKTCEKDKAPHADSDKLTKRCESSQLIFIYSYTQSHLVSKTLKSHLSASFCLNFYEIRIATILGKPAAKRREQDPESSAKFQERVCPYKVRNTSFFVEQKQNCSIQKVECGRGRSHQAKFDPFGGQRKYRANAPKSAGNASAASPPCRPHTEDLHHPRSAVDRRIDSVTIGKAHGLTTHD